MKEYLQVLADGGTLTREEAEGAMNRMMRGEASPEETAGLLMGLRARGETIDELVGFTSVMRAYAVPVELDDPHAIDLCGTGGDSTGTFNISTAASFVCAGAGVTVAKHGNRSVSSKSGSADVLEALGVRVELGKEGVEFCLREVGIAFLFAPYFHPAMRFVMPVRRGLGVRTFFNILGPLCNPAGVRRQLVGAFSPETAQTMASILAHLDARHIVAVHGDDGMDEISLSAETTVFQYDGRNDGGMKPHAPQAVRVRPEDYGLGRAPLDTLQGGTAEENAAIVRRVFDGEHGPHRDVVVLNAAYALLTSGRFADLDACFTAARTSLDGGAARTKLEQLAVASREAPGVGS